MTSNGSSPASNSGTRITRPSRNLITTDFGIRIRTTRSIGIITSPTLLDLNEIFPALAPDISPKRIEPLLSSIRVGSSVASSCAIALGAIAVLMRKKTVPKIKVNRLLRIIGNPNSYLQMSTTNCGPIIDSRDLNSTRKSLFHRAPLELGAFDRLGFY